MRICFQLREYGEDGVSFPNEVLGKDSAQVSSIYEGFGQGSVCFDDAGVYKLYIKIMQRLAVF